MTPRISACLLACDEEASLARCLDSLDWVDERVVVVDARSSDGSEKIARERADVVEVRPYEGDIAQKRYCTELASHDWVIVIDPDEVVPRRLSEELQVGLDSVGPEVDAFMVNRVTYHLGRWLRHGDFYPDWKLRIFRRSKARWEGRDPHGRVEVAGELLYLRGELQHYSYRDLADQIDRIQFFSSEAAAALYAEGRRVSWRDLVLRPPARFLRAYLLKRGFLDGRAGLVVAGATAFHVFLKYAKLWELERNAGASAEASGNEPRAR